MKGISIVIYRVSISKTSMPKFLQFTIDSSERPTIQRERVEERT